MNEHKRQKKLEHQRRKREGKRKAAAPPRSLWHRRGEPEPGLALLKMSEALKILVLHELDALPKGATVKQVETLLLIAMDVWNAVITGRRSEEEARLRELSLVIQDSSGAPSEIILPLLRELAERKRRLFPNDHRRVVDVAVVDAGYQFRIRAMSVPGPSRG